MSPQEKSLKRKIDQHGAATVYFLLFALVIFGFLVMAADVGRMYMIQGELQTAADAAALAAATRLVGTLSAPLQAASLATASFDTTTTGDNRFNLRMNQILGPGLVSETGVDFFYTMQDAMSNLNGGQSGGIDWNSGAYPKYARMQITAQAPVLFLPLLIPAAGSLPTIRISAVAGVSVPACTACGIDALAVEDQSGRTDELNYGFVPGDFYTLYLTTSQQAATRPVDQAPLAGTSVSVRYAILYHVPNNAQNLDLDSTLFALAAGGISSSPDVFPPGTVSIDAVESGYPDLQGSSATVGQDILCGLNTRFGADASQNVCGSLGSGAFTGLSTLYSADTDLGRETYSGGDGLQDYAEEYDGNLRRVLTVAVVDTVDSLNVLNFRQFLIEMSPAESQGLDPTLVTGAFVAQYLGTPVPLRCGGIGGSCKVSFGIGRVVLH